MTALPWPWWLGALALASIAVLYSLALGRPLGVSGHIQRILRNDGSRDQGFLFLAGLTLGGAVAAATAASGGGLELQGLDALQAEFFGSTGTLAALFFGGILVGFGTALAGGCTSGHGLVGCARLQPASLVATAAFFGTAVAVSFLIAEVVR